MLAPAWSRAPNDAGNEIVLPVFDSWSFSVAPAGDFELLAGRLQGLPRLGMSDAASSMRPIRVAGCPNLPADAPGAVQVLRCALVSPTPLPPDLPPENSAWDAPAREKLRHEIDRVNANQEETLPRVGPRLYARFQRGQAASARFSASRLTTLPRPTPTGFRSSTLHPSIASSPASARASCSAIRKS